MYVTFINILYIFDVTTEYLYEYIFERNMGKVHTMYLAINTKREKKKVYGW